MSAHIAIRCECGKLRLFVPDALLHDVRYLLQMDGWSVAVGGGDCDICPFCTAQQKAREKVEADARA